MTITPQPLARQPRKAAPSRPPTNAFIAARANAADSPNTSSTDAFAQARADVQAGYTCNTIADGARKWVPILNIVLTTVFYAMFPVIFPLFLLPETGLSVLKGYFTGFFYLAAWGPLYAVLNMIAVTRFTTGGLAAANGGMTLGNAAALRAVSADVSEVAGYMLAFVPFIAAGMARGTTAIGSSATSFLAPSQNAAEAAAGEAATGNYSYGNVNLQNLQAQNTSSHRIVQHDQLLRPILWNHSRHLVQKHRPPRPLGQPDHPHP